MVTTTGPTLTCADIVGIGSEKAALDLRSVSKCAMKQAEKARIAQALREKSREPGESRQEPQDQPCRVVQQIA